MKMNIQITQKTSKYVTWNNEKVVEIDIKNGNWKYWDYHQDTNEKTSLTINNIADAFYLHQPVKDTYTFYNHEAIKNEHKLIIEGVDVRMYETLIEYLNRRINNAKEDYKAYGDKEKVYKCVLFEQEFENSRTNDATGNIIYEVEGLLEVKITMVE